MATEPVTDFRAALEGTAASTTESSTAQDIKIIGIDSNGRSIVVDRTTEADAGAGSGPGWMDAQRTAQAIEGSTSDPFSFGVATPNITRWTQTLFPSEYEAEADRDITATERTTRMRAIIDRAGQEGKEVVIPRSSTPYLYDSYLNTRNAKGIRIIPCGDLINTQSDDSLGGIKQAVFRMGNYHPVYLNESVGGLTWYTLDSFSAGIDTPVLTSGTNRTEGLAALQAAGVGSVVVVRDRNYYLSAGNINAHVPESLVLAHILDFTASGPVLDRALIEAMNEPIIALVNSPSLDIEGQPLFVADSVTIEGPGTLNSLYGSAINRTGMIDCKVNVGEVSAADSAFLVNFVGKSTFHAERLFVSKRFVEFACGSHDTTVSWGSGEVIGTVGGRDLIKIGENSRDVTVRWDHLNAGEFSDSGYGALLAGNCRRVLVDGGFVNAPSLVYSFASVTSAVEPDLGGYHVQPVTEDITLRFGQVHLGASSRYVHATNLSGENRRLRVESGQFFGTLTNANAFELDGTDHYIGPVVCEDGALRITAGATSLTVDPMAYFEDGISSSVSLATHTVRGGVRSASQKLLRSGASEQKTSASSSTTTANSSALSSTFPAGALKSSDAVEIEVFGTVTGTNGAKTIQITDDTGSVATLSLLAADTGAFHVTALVSIQSNAAYNVSAEVRGAASIATTRTRRTGLDLELNGRTFNIERWLDNASDSITVDYAVITPKRYGYTA